jgi:hypothetical protein
MVIPTKHTTRNQGAWLMVELLAAIALLTGALLPVAYAFTAERRLARAQYHHAVAMSIVNGELEILAAGGWRGLQPGTHDYPISAGAATNLPPGVFLATFTNRTVRLEWLPAGKTHAVIKQEVRLQ